MRWRSLGFGASGRNRKPLYVPQTLETSPFVRCIGSEGCVLTYRVSDRGEALIRGRSPTAEPGTSDLAPARPVFLLDLAELRLKLLETLDEA